MARLTKKNEELFKAVQRQAVREQGNSSAPEIQAGSEEALRTDTETDIDAETGATQQTSAVGLGVDLVEIERMECALKRTPRILERVFTSGEREYAWSKTRPAVHYATFFAAREAVLKALGCGFAGINYSDVEITHDERGKPEVLLHGNASVVAKQQGVVEIQISLSHTHQMAVASAVAIKEQSSSRKVEFKGPMEELARQFRELRSILDDLGVSGIIDQSTQEGQETQERQEESVGSEAETNEEQQINKEQQGEQEPA